MTPKERVYIDASTFQTPLERLAEVLAQKVFREAPKLLKGKAPEFVSMDLHILIRHAIFTYDFFFYLNADERVETDHNWRYAYSILTLPLIRNMIDDLFNVTFILQDPVKNGTWFRESGFKQAMSNFDEDEKTYGGVPEWDEWIKKGREGVHYEMQRNGLRVADVQAQTSWLTLGKYVRLKQKGGTYTPHQKFLITFTHGKWREYSSMAHGAFEGLMKSGMYYIADVLPPDKRHDVMKNEYEKTLFIHISRAATLLLAIVTELQIYFHFDDDGARINERIHEMWRALLPLPEAKEIYDGHYARLMKNNGI